MDISFEQEGSELVVALKGNLDTLAAPELESALFSKLDGVEKLVFDLTELDYIASSGLRVLLASQKRMNRQGEMIVRGANSDVMDIFEMTGFVEFLTIE